MSISFADKLHLSEYILPEIEINPDGFFKNVSESPKILAYLRLKIRECIKSFNFPKSSTCRITIKKIPFSWYQQYPFFVPCIINKRIYEHRFPEVNPKIDIVIRSFAINIKCARAYYPIVFDKVILSLFSGISKDYPIHLITSGTFPDHISKNGLDLIFALIYPSSMENDTSCIPPYNPDFKWPNYNQIFKDISKQMKQRKDVCWRSESETGEIWTKVREKICNQDIPNLRPDCWCLYYDFNNRSDIKFYIRGSDDEINGLRYILKGYQYNNFVPRLDALSVNGDVDFTEWENDQNLFDNDIKTNTLTALVNDVISNDNISKKEIDYTDSEVQFQEGVCCNLTGEGVEASYWFTKSAEQGNWKAMYSLALLYYDGELLEKNYDISLKWFTKSADEDDDGWADFFLGEMYANGYGVEKNLNKARYWYSRAADKGHDDALKTIHKLGLEYDDIKYLEKKEHEEELKWNEEEKRKLEEVDEWEREIQEKEEELKSEYPKLLEYFNAEEYSQPNYEIDLSAFYTSKHADGKPIIDEIVNQQFHKCCNRFGLFDDSENGQNCFLSAGSDSYFNTPRLLNTFRLTKKYNKINDTGKLLIRTFDLDIELDNFDSSDLPKAKEAISLFLKEMNKDYPCFIERYSINYHVWHVDDFDENDRIFIVIGIIYPAEYEETPLILPTENQTIKSIDSIRLIDACRDELLANRNEVKAILDANNIKGTRSITDYKTDMTKDRYNFSFSNIGEFESEYCYSDRGCVMNDNLVLSYFMRGSIEEKNAIKTSLLLGYNLTIVGYRNAKFDRDDLLNGNFY